MHIPSHELRANHDIITVLTKRKPGMAGRYPHTPLMAWRFWIWRGVRYGAPVQMEERESEKLLILMFGY